MSDRASLTMGRSTIVLPRFTRSLVQVATAVALTAAVCLVIVVLNNMLTLRGGWVQGINAWMIFIKRSDIVGTMALTAIVTIAVYSWQGGDRR